MKMYVRNCKCVMCKELLPCAKSKRMRGYGSLNLLNACFPAATIFIFLSMLKESSPLNMKVDCKKAKLTPLLHTQRN